jgi:hypothetical protein
MFSRKIKTKRFFRNDSFSEQNIDKFQKRIKELNGLICINSIYKVYMKINSKLIFSF